MGRGLTMVFGSVTHTALDGSTVEISGPSDLSQPATSIAACRGATPMARAGKHDTLRGLGLSVGDGYRWVERLLS